MGGVWEEGGGVGGGGYASCGLGSLCETDALDSSSNNRMCSMDI